MKSLKKEFPNQVYSLNAPAREYSTEILQNELKTLSRTWYMQLRLNHKRSIESLMNCMNEIRGELKLRKSSI